MIKQKLFGSLLVIFTLFISIIGPKTSVALAETQSDHQDPQVVAEQVTHFSKKLRPLLLAEDDNLIYSPFSYYLALLLLEPGLNSEQQTLLDDALLPEDLSRSDYLSTLENVLTESMAKENAAFQTQTYLLAGMDKTWSDDYLASVEDLASVLKLVDFSDAATYEELNQDIADFTKGLIQPFYSEERISELTQNDQLHLLVLNMLYFKGEWQKTFDEAATTQDVFYGKAEESTVDMMSQTTLLDYLETDDFQAVQMNYTNGAKFLVLLPKEGNEELTNDQMWQFYDDALKEKDKWEKKNVQLTLPKWQASASLDLTDSLDLLGLETFKEKLSDTTYFTEEADTLLSQITQRIEFNLDEKGTEAVAVTEIIMETTAIYIDEEETIELTVNRPFIYRLSYSELPLFEGIVQNLSN